MASNTNAQQTRIPSKQEDEATLRQWTEENSCNIESLESNGLVLEVTQFKQNFDTGHFHYCFAKLKDNRYFIYFMVHSNKEVKATFYFCESKSKAEEGKTYSGKYIDTEQKSHLRCCNSKEDWYNLKMGPLEIVTGLNDIAYITIRDDIKEIKSGVLELSWIDDLNLEVTPVWNGKVFFFFFLW